MTPLTLTLPEDVMAQAQTIAEMTERQVEDVVLEHLRTLRAPDSTLPKDIVSELDALHFLSDDALWLIAREQLPDAVQSRADDLLDDSHTEDLPDARRNELSDILDRADRLMLRKAEAAVLLKQRGYLL